MYMPAGIDNPVIGYAAFCGVKLAGYSLYGLALRKWYPNTKQSFWVLGLCRTAIGMLFGALCFGIVLLAGSVAGGSPPGLVFIAGLAPVRVLEWWILIWLFCDRKLNTMSRDWCWVILGVIFSYCLDLPAILGFIFAGGFWIC